MKVSFRPAVRVDTPLIIGIAGPTKSGKTYSALRLASGLANGKPIAMLNAEGPRGHQYAEKFTYMSCELTAPYRPDSYIEALQAAKGGGFGCVIVDSVSHCHDGPGGILEWHEELLDKMAGADFSKRDKCNFSAWIKPKAAENKLIYTMLEMNCPLILCMRAKEKIKLETGKPPKDLGWQPIVGERIAFETIFTLMLTPGCKGVPDLSLSDMREPFDSMVQKGSAINELLGKKLAQWATGTKSEGAVSADPEMPKPSAPQGAEDSEPPPQNYERTQAMMIADWKAAFDSTTTKAECVKTWDKVVRDGYLTGPSRSVIYNYYQAMVGKMA